MSTIRKPLTIAIAVAAALIAQGAWAQATRTWVSGVGDDANPCSRTAPCKTFAGAISKTAAGGEISALDPGGFGAVTITKAITINGDGTLAGILAAGTNGIIINAGVNDRVVLRSISINGAGTGLNGIRYLAGKEVVVENCTIHGFTTRGIDVSLVNSGVLRVRNATISGVATGIRVATTVGSVTAVVDNVALQTLGTGFEGAGGSFSSIRNSLITSNTTGVIANVNGANVNVENSILSFNGTAANASVLGAVLRLSNNQIYTNTTGIALAGGAFVFSTADNRISGNGGSAAPNQVITQQ